MGTSKKQQKSNFEHIFSTYVEQNGPVLFLTFDQEGVIQQSNRYTEEIIGADPRNKNINEVIFSIASGKNFQDLLKPDEQLLNVQTFTGLPQTYYFRFFRRGEMMIALGRLDLKEMEHLRKRLIDLSSNINNLNRQLHKANAELVHARENLEERVKVRTKELTRANADLVAENRERKKAQKALNQSEKKLKRLSARLLEAHEEERKRVAADLHDGLAQSLSTVQVWLGAAMADIASDHAAAIKSLQAARRLSQEAIDEVQRISRNLRPSMLDNLGLYATIQWLCNRFEQIHPDICINIQLGFPEEMIPEPLKIVIFRILQEALNNIAKHSKARFAEISLKATGKKAKKSSLKLTIHDQGQGFNPKRVQSDHSILKGMGLSTMKERAQLSGGSFSISSQPGAGTIIKAQWPL
jgi:signal transduction histidine kinase